ncbi:MAG: hypothetical protein DDT37_01290 [Firmicutes bacterium]|nr:hypothetical protein [candidate division NPL-UPA2 bacterium]
MSLDGFVLNALVQELNTELVGLRCEKIHQPTRHTVTLLLSGTGKKHRLVISADPLWPRLMLTSEAWVNPPSPPFFCLMLRKYLTGARVTELSVTGFERVVTATFSGRDELGNTANYRLMVELTGRHSNAVLVAPNNTVLDALTRVSINLSSVRAVLPGLRYELPPAQGRISPLSVDGDYLFHAAKESAFPVYKLLRTSIQGVSQLLANELAYRHAPNAQASDLDSLEWEQIAVHVRQLALSASAGEILAGHVYRSGKTHFHVLPLTHLQVPGQLVCGINSLVAGAFLSANRGEQLESLRLSLRKVAAASLAKTERRMQALRGDLQKNESREESRRFGDLLYANLGAQRVEAGEAVVIDYYHENMPEVRIPLDPKRSFAENARQYYKQYTRAQSASRHATERLHNDVVYLDYLETLLYSIDTAPDTTTLREIGAEMCTVGLMPVATTAKRQAPAPSVPRKFICPEGMSISVGRTNLQNDVLVREAHPEHCWLHVQKAPGSHVLIHTTRAPSEATLHYAANLAAYYSKLRASANVPVDYTLRKFVKRPPHARPGYVVYERQRTLYVKRPTAPEDTQQDSNSNT